MAISRPKYGKIGNTKKYSLQLDDNAVIVAKSITKKIVSIYLNIS